MTTRQQIEDRARPFGLTIHTNRPGDGTRRYRFTNPQGSVNVSPVLCGVGQVEIWLQGYAAGLSKVYEARVGATEQSRKAALREWIEQHCTEDLPAGFMDLLS